MPPDQTKHVTLLTYWLLGLYKIGKKVLIKSESRGAIDQKVARSGTFPGNTSLKIRSTCAALTLVISKTKNTKIPGNFCEVIQRFTRPSSMYRALKKEVSTSYLFEKQWTFLIDSTTILIQFE